MCESTKISIMLLGNCQVGKTSYAIKLTSGMYYDDYAGTIGSDFSYLSMYVRKKNYNIHIHDTSGNNIFETILLPIYRKVYYYIIMYDITNVDSFSSIYDWYQNIQKYTENFEESKILLLGNKFDSNLNERYISFNSVNAYAKSMNMYYDEISVKDNNNIRESLYNFIRQVAKEKEKEKSICVIT